MIKCEGVTRKWGNSLGLRLPKDIVQEGHLKEDEKLTILIVKRKQPLKKTFGTAKKLKKSSQQIKDELRKELYNE